MKVREPGDPVVRYTNRWDNLYDVPLTLSTDQSIVKKVDRVDLVVHTLTPLKPKVGVYSHVF